MAYSLARRGVRGKDLYWELVYRVAGRPTDLRLRIGDGVISLNPADVLETAMFQGAYDRAETRLLPLLARPGGTCIDVGANVGFYTLMLAAAVGKSGRIIALEPAPTVHWRLAAHTAHLPYVSALALAAGRADGDATLSTWVNNSGLASLNDHGWTDATGMVNIHVSTLDTLSNELSIDEIDVLKVDAEGTEAQVIEGAAGLLDRDAIRALLVEANPQWGAIDFLAGLGERGFALYRIAEQPSVTKLRSRPCLMPLPDLRCLDRQSNVLALRPDLIIAIERACRGRLRIVS
jgi:FkbM family methyltransferase